MKKLLSTIALLSLALCIYAGGNKDFKKFYRHHKRDQGVINFWIPKMVMQIATVNEEPYVKQLVHSTSKIRIMIKEEGAAYLYDALNKSLSKDTYKDLLYVKDGGENVRITAKIVNENIKEILIIVNGEDEFVAIQLKGNYHIDALKKLAKELS